MPGTITLRPIEANLSPKSSLHNKTDPHYTLVLGKQHITSQECNEGVQHPHWNKLSALQLKTTVDSTCVLELKDEDMLFSDENIGFIEVNLKEVEATGHLTKWYPISLDGQQAGEVLFEASFKQDESLHGHVHNLHVNGKKTAKEEFVVGKGLLGSLDPLRAPAAKVEKSKSQEEEEESPHPQNDLFLDIGKYKSPPREERDRAEVQREEYVEQLDQDEEDEEDVEESEDEDEGEDWEDAQKAQEDEDVELLNKDESDYVREEAEYQQNPEDMMAKYEDTYDHKYRKKTEDEEEIKKFDEEGLSDDEEIVFTNGHVHFCKTNDLASMENIDEHLKEIQPSNVLLESELNNGLMGIQNQDVPNENLSSDSTESPAEIIAAESMPPFINKDAQMLMEEAYPERKLNVEQQYEEKLFKDEGPSEEQEIKLTKDEDVQDEDYLDEVDDRPIGMGKYDPYDQNRVPSYKEIMGGWDI